MHRCYRSFINM